MIQPEIRIACRCEPAAMHYLNQKTAGRILFAASCLARITWNCLHFVKAEIVGFLCHTPESLFCVFADATATVQDLSESGSPNRDEGSE
jgi:hypothetical protein